MRAAGIRLITEGWWAICGLMVVASILPCPALRRLSALIIEILRAQLKRGNLGARGVFSYYHDHHRNTDDLHPRSFQKAQPGGVSSIERHGRVTHAGPSPGHVLYSTLVDWDWPKRSRSIRLPRSNCWSSGYIRNPWWRPWELEIKKIVSRGAGMEGIGVFCCISYDCLYLMIPQRHNEQFVWRRHNIVSTQTHQYFTKT